MHSRRCWYRIHNITLIDGEYREKTVKPEAESYHVPKCI